MITNVHKPIMVKEISSFLNNDKELSILDCTFGGGGHTMSFLDLGHKVIAIDEDLKAQEIAKDLMMAQSLFYWGLTQKESVQAN